MATVSNHRKGPDVAQNYATARVGACIDEVMPAAVRGKLKRMASDVDAWQELREDDPEAAEEDAEHLPQPTIRVWDASGPDLVRTPADSREWPVGSGGQGGAKDGT